MTPAEEWEGFDWDDGNLGKNWPKHHVTDWEAEEVFFNSPLSIRADSAHSRTEDRYFALGVTNGGRPLFIAFTVRRRLVRVISARPMTDRELRIYETRKENAGF